MKTPKILRAAINNYNRAVMYTDALIRVKNTVPLEYQADHVRNGNPALWIARLEGQQVMLESMLHEAKCYAGFMYTGPNSSVGKDGTVTVSHVTYNSPEFREYRRAYIVRE